MDKSSHVEDFFALFKERQDNHVCFDCKSDDPDWASVNNGILCCYDCISVHRTLATQYSVARSTQLDMWNEKQLAMMDKGGNYELWQWFEKFDLNSESILVKYQSRAAEYYR
jgi:ribosomal protein L37AE/L43A